jgi:environmental stress-induced protein Ves
MRRLPAAGRTPEPWKNGCGVTSEVAIFPPGAGFDDFDWRISMAEVAANGPFSAFPGIDRVLTVLDGAMTLAIEGMTDVALDERARPFAFPGDVVVSAVVKHGPVRDLNVMWRRDGVGAEVERRKLDGRSTLAPSDATVLFVQTGRIAVTASAAITTLESGDALLIDASDGVLEVDAPHPSTVVVIGLKTG